MHQGFFRLCITGFSLFALLLSGECRAEFSLHPGLYTRLEMTDNLFLSETDKYQEWIVTVAPYLWLAQRSKELNISLQYRYERYRYLNQPSFNDRADTHIGILDGVILPERALRIELYADARRENLDRRRSDVVDLPLSNTTNRYLGRIRPVYHLDIGLRHYFETAYSYETVQYDTQISDETETQRVELLLNRRQSTLLDLQLEGLYEHLAAKINYDYDRIQGRVGGEWRPFASTTISAKAGMTWFEYETGENFNTRVYDCQLFYTPVVRWVLDLHYIKNFDYDIQDGLYRIWRGDGGIAYNSRLSWRLGLLFSMSEYVQVRRDDQEYGVVGTATYRLTPKVLFGINADGRRLELEPVTENIDRYSLGASFVYTPREYIIFGCRYIYRNSDSDLDINDYRENRVSCDLRLTYNMIH
ncbi:MAG: hypothetical protein IBX47_09730 [Desulfuromonadales bacterium]|nr:hypothetical protein [Desulfuromonadales bacterium]